MAGLLDGLGGLSGDNTVKDEFGQTQADRRDPIWSGLIKAGLLAVAGGSNVMPETRAKYLAEAGGAIGDIPSNMIAQAGASAQQKLRGQQLDEGKRKVADRDRVRALAQTPEFQEAIKGAKGGDKIAIQAAIDTGDIAALNAAISNLDKTAIGFAKNETALAKLEAAKAKAENQGSYTGNAEAIQHLRNLQTKDPSTFEYWAAHDFYSQDRKAPDGTIIPKMSNIDTLPKPTYVDPRTGAPPAPGGPKPDQEVSEAEKIGWAMKPGDPPVTLPNGTRITRDTQGGLRIEPPDADMTYQPSQTAAKTRKPLQAIPDKTLETLNKAHIGLTKMDSLETEMKKGGFDVGSLQTFFLSDKWLNKTNPEGAKARAILSGIATEIVHSLAGSAVTEAEMKKLEGKIPQSSDDPATFQVKLEELKQELQITGAAHLTNLGPGYRVSPEHRKRFGGAAKVPTWNPATGKVED